MIILVKSMGYVALFIAGFMIGYYRLWRYMVAGNLEGYQRERKVLMIVILVLIILMGVKYGIQHM